MLRGIVLLFFIFSFSIATKAFTKIIVLPQDSLVADTLTTEKELPKRKNVRIKAIVFTLLTGPLGGHRVYLGTRPGAPIIYSITLGGFGILPLVDLAHLIFTKDISKFEQNQKIIMWGGDDE